MEFSLTQYMKCIEINSEYFGTHTLELMEQAGKSVANYINTHFMGKKIAIVCGKGNNGGDGFVAARYLNNVTIFYFDTPKTAIAKKNFDLCQCTKIKMTSTPDFSSYDIVVDAIFGTGIRGELKDPYNDIISKINESNYIIAVDVASGVNPDTGQTSSIYVKPHLTISFEKKKQCLDGKCIVKKIFPRIVYTHFGPGHFQLIPKRNQGSHKRDSGTVLIVGGSHTYTGAPALSAMAALRCGIDLSYIFAPKETAHIISSFSPDLITIKGQSAQDIKPFVEKADVTLLGPGLELSESELSSILSICTEKIVLDAGALEIFVKKPELFSNKKVILTPHKGEFKRLFSVKPSKENIENISKKYNCTLLVKGQEDIIASKTEIMFNSTGNAGMTVGGTGDVLAGCVAAFFAQCDNPMITAGLAAYLCGRCGEKLFEKKDYNFVASDLLNVIPQCIMEDKNWELGRL